MMKLKPKYIECDAKIIDSFNVFLTIMYWIIVLL